MQNVAIYIRWSTEDQGEGTTLDVQLDGCRHYLLSQGWQVREDLIFIDDGHSGATLRRPALTRLREQVKAGAVDCVVVYKLDRLSRSVADTARLCMDEWEGLCHVKSAREPIETTSQAGRMFFYTLMNYAEWERAVIRDRTHSGRLRRAQEGRNPGITLPYGYTREPATGGFAVVPHEAAVVRRIFAAYRLGAGLIRLAGALNAEGIPFRGGRRWQVQTIRYLLGNRAYAGDLVWGRRTVNPKYGKRAGERQRAYREEPLVIREGVFPAIIDRAEFDQVQRVRAERPCRQRGGGGRSMASAYLLTGRLRCGSCGAAMIGRGGRYYGCLTRAEKGPGECPAPATRCHLVDGCLSAGLLSLYASEEIRRRARALLQTDTSARRREWAGERAEVDRQLTRLAARERQLGRAFGEGEITLAELRLVRSALQERSVALQAARELLTAQLSALPSALPQAEPDAWAALTPDQRKQVLRHLARRVTVVSDGPVIHCEILWNVPAGNLVDSTEEIMTP